jgi:hypothetical protein
MKESKHAVEAGPTPVVPSCTVDLPTGRVGPHPCAPPARTMASAAETTEKPRARKDLGGGLPLRKRLGKLFTKEDPVHLHKTLGLLSLLSYLYRYFYLWPTTGALGFAEAGIRDWAGVVLHTALSSSSLIFTVIRLRILDKPTIIWEEYRLHAIVFTMCAPRFWALAAATLPCPHTHPLIYPPRTIITPPPHGDCL